MDLIAREQASATNTQNMPSNKRFWALIADDVMKEEEMKRREVVSESSAGSWRRWSLVYRASRV